MLHTKYQGSWPCGFRQKILKFYLENLFLACVTKICNGPKPLEKQIKEGLMRIIPAKFGQYPPCSLGGDVL